MNTAYSNADAALSDPWANAASVSFTDGAWSGPAVTRGLYVGGAGDVEVVMLGGQTVTYVGVPAGTILGCRVTSVLEAGTTATDILAIW